MNKYYCDIYKSDENIRTVNVNAKILRKLRKRYLGQIRGISKN